MFSFKTKSDNRGRLDVGLFQGQAFPQGEYEVLVLDAEEAGELRSLQEQLDQVERSRDAALMRAEDLEAELAAYQAGPTPAPAQPAEPASAPADASADQSPEEKPAAEVEPS